MIEACEGTDEEFAVLSLDLDGLKEVNDVFGHATGDKLLIEVARRIKASARGGVVARLSGDEFGLIIDGKQPVAGMLLAEQLAEALAKEFQIDGKSVRTGVHHRHLDLSAQWRGCGFPAGQCRRGAVPRQGEIARLDQHL